MNRAVVVYSAGLVACALSPFPNTQTPIDRAREVSARCNFVLEASSAPSASSIGLESVEPAYAHIATGNGSEQRLRGAKIHLRPLPGVTAQSIERSLKCRESSSLLGQSQSSADDPFVLPHRWIEIDVSAEDDGFVALIRADTFEDAKRILERARRYAAAAEPGRKNRNEAPPRGPF